jgi:hypothetical protein
MTYEYVNDFFTNTFINSFIPFFVTCGIVYFIVLSFRKVSGV